MRTAEIADLLEHVTLFRGLTKSQLNKIARVSVVRTARAGDKVVREGTFRSGGSVAFFVIAEGSADVTVRGKKVGALKQGDSFGEMSLLDGRPRSATVVAKTDMVLCRLTSQHFSRLVKSEPSVALGLLRTMADRLRKIDKGRY